MLREARAAIIARPGLVGVSLRDALADAFDGWLRQAVPERPGLAHVAVGGLGRREMAPHSDLDLMLLYDRSVQDLPGLADRIWYPIWDSRVGLDHSARTVDQALAVAGTDMKAMLSLLDIRHVAGDAGLAGELREKTLAQWRGSAARRADDLHELTRARGRAVGEVAFALEPDLKQGRGGLRDWHALRALSMAQLMDVPDVVRSGSRLLLDVRGELQRLIGGPEDVLRLQEQPRWPGRSECPPTTRFFAPSTRRAGRSRTRWTVPGARSRRLGVVRDCAVAPGPTASRWHTT